MQDYRVETFLAVCRTLNYTRAAEELNITQPAVSQHIAFLEKEYGAKLFSYANRKLSLTPAGELVRRTLAAMAHDDRLLRESVAACERTSALSLSIGMTLTAGEYVVAAPLATYLRAHPEMQVRLRSRGTEELLGALDEGVIDCAFVEGFFDKSVYAWDTFSTERLVAICAPGHALAGRTCAFEDLLSEHVLVREEGSGTRAVLEHALAARNLALASFARTTEVGSINVIKSLVAGGFGLSFMFAAAVSDDVARGRLSLIEIAGPPICHDITFIRLKGSTFEGDFQRLFDDLKEC